jgi:ethanolaminephosphotransferase
VLAGLVLAQKLLPAGPVVLVQGAYLLLLLQLLSSRGPWPARLLQAFTPLAFLLHRAPSLPGLALLLLQLRLLRPVVAGLHPGLRPLAGLLLAKVAFFQLGGSNSLATVAVGAGYTGLTAFHPVPVGMLLAAHTYSGPLLVLLDGQAAGGARPTQLLRCLAPVLGAELALFSLLALTLRHHLFVWTVFSPKLLYLGMQLVVYTALATILAIGQ